jgi:hypothetical protein
LTANFVRLSSKNYGISQMKLSLISGFRRDVDEICPFLGYYAASCRNCLPTFLDNISVPSSRRSICCPETSVNNYHTTQRNILEERKSQIKLLFFRQSYFRLATFSHFEECLAKHGKILNYKLRKANSSYKSHKRNHTIKLRLMQNYVSAPVFTFILSNA